MTLTICATTWSSSSADSNPELIPGAVLQTLRATSHLVILCLNYGVRSIAEARDDRNGRRLDVRKTFMRLASITLVVLMAAPGLPSARAQEPVHVVSTFSILTDLIEQIGGEHVEVTTLVSSNADAHNFEPSPEQVIQLADADLIVKNGVGFEPWLDGMIEASQTGAILVDASLGVPLRSAEGEVHTDEDDDHDAEEHEDDHDHGEFDPHIWQDVTNVITMVGNIRDGLSTVDPDHAADFAANADAYIVEMEALDTWIMAEVATLPAESRKLVTSHDTFGYFAARYGFEVIGSPFSLSTEQAEPAAQDIAALIDIIEHAGVPAIFTENVGNTGLMEQIASSAGVTLAPPLYTDALSEPGTPGDTYLGMMRANTETIIEALRA